eukprot:CAMPEP_0184314830 /NCGR_PEP_ID=MMETSP1049-20130417/77452_1 /TAXON_ID=77928 /ORGANISM="Proteomonas sulcata, Strain CCMP704" /LENGTH=148 /DNA_ID=CAMNT_0026632969 /DNA_START=300 /DNA_END=746 /DNA_ORIENTATION=-
MASCKDPETSSVVTNSGLEDILHKLMKESMAIRLSKRNGLQSSERLGLTSTSMLPCPPAVRHHACKQKLTKKVKGQKNINGRTVAKRTSMEGKKSAGSKRSRTGISETTSTHSNRSTRSKSSHPSLRDGNEDVSNDDVPLIQQCRSGL